VPLSLQLAHFVFSEHFLQDSPQVLIDLCAQETANVKMKRKDSFFMPFSIAKASCKAT